MCKQGMGICIYFSTDKMTSIQIQTDTVTCNQWSITTCPHLLTYLSFFLGTQIMHIKAGSMVMTWYKYKQGRCLNTALRQTPKKRHLSYDYNDDILHIFLKHEEQTPQHAQCICNQYSGTTNPTVKNIYLYMMKLYTYTWNYIHALKNMLLYDFYMYHLPYNNIWYVYCSNR